MLTQRSELLSHLIEVFEEQLFVDGVALGDHRPACRLERRQTFLPRVAAKLQLLGSSRLLDQLGFISYSKSHQFALISLDEHSSIFYGTQMK